MLKSELIKRVATLNPELEHDTCALAVNTFIEELARHLEAHKRIELRGLGSFTVGQPLGGTRLNPYNGKPAGTPGKPRIRFRPSSTLANQILRDD